MVSTFRMLGPTALALVAMTAGCGSVSGPQDAGEDVRSDAKDAPATVDSPTQVEAGADGAPDAPPANDAGAEHAPSCQQRVYDDTKGVFVVGTANASAFCGDRGMPCNTIAGGIARAAELKRSIVYVAAGTYTEAISVAPGVRVEGDWSVFGATWTPLCDSPGDAVVIQAPASSNVTVSAKDLGGSASLAWLTIRSKASADPGQSLYGVFAAGTSTNLTLEGVKVIVANAGAGSAGSPGAGGPNGSSSGCTLASASDGASAAGAGTAGNDGTPSGFGPNGYTTSNGTAGGDGAPGHNGPVGSAGGCITDCGSCKSQTACNSLPNSCGGAGLPGCAGGAGKGGGGGGGGGSSIALYVWGANVTVIGGSLKAGNGGNGGGGAAGGGRGIGAAGATGPSATTACTKCTVTYTPPSGSTGSGTYSCSIASLGYGPGGAPNGTGGGNGSDGGKGGGGAGGSSFAIYKAGQGAVTTSAASQLTVGVAGAAGGSSNAGVAKDVGP